MIGYGASQLSLVTDERTWPFPAEFSSEERGDYIGEHLRVRVSQPVAESICQAKRVSVVCASNDCSISFDLSDDALAGFGDLLDQIAVTK